MDAERAQRLCDLEEALATARRWIGSLEEQAVHEKHQLDGALSAAGNVPVLESVFQKPEFKKVYPFAPDILAELNPAMNKGE